MTLIFISERIYTGSDNRDMKLQRYGAVVDTELLFGLNTQSVNQTDPANTLRTWSSTEPTQKQKGGPRLDLNPGLLQPLPAAVQTELSDSVLNTL